MPLNLISDAWIPVRRTDGTRQTIAPSQMADPGLAFPDWPRPDLNIACLELLIGLVFLADPPAHDEEWEARQAPDAARLCDRLAPFAPAFNLMGDGPRFLQDIEPLEGDPNPPDMIFIDSAGGNTAKNNADLMVRRGRYPVLDPALAAMALYTFQAFAPSGGAGNRTSMRGGGPMVTLVDPGQGLWPLIWANVPDGKPARVSNLPWMKPTPTSEKGQQHFPEQAHPVEAFFGLPRRLRLVGDDSGITGVIQRPYGTNYAGWQHPLSPYYRLKPGEEWLPKHPRAGRFGYRNWLGVTVASEEGDQSVARRAAMVREWPQRGSGPAAQVIVAGWAMDNMKPRDFTYSAPPLLTLDDAALDTLTAMIATAEQVSLALRAALAPVLSEGEAREAVREAFYAETEPAFERLAAGLTAVNLAETAEDWVREMEETALGLFERQALPGLADRDQKTQQAIVAAHRFLRAGLAGRGKYTDKAFARLWLSAGKTEAAA